MATKCDGYLAADGTFWETEPECERHEHAQALIGLCDSHGVNADNFFMLLREWHVQIEGYYDADHRCKESVVITTGSIAFDDVPGLPQSEDDRENPFIGDKDAPSFLQQQARRRK
jgi:hypothetical protein